jgi:hypothetical protein
VGLACNIDARGKALRFRLGLILAALGALLALVWAAPTGSKLGWIVAGALLLAGGGSLFEARAGWCVVRAMGFRTRY